MIRGPQTRKLILSGCMLVLGLVYGLQHVPADPQMTRWVKQDGPTLTATETWEGSAIQEPSVLYEDGQFRLWYRGGWENCALGLATSTDGLTWTKSPNNPLLQGTCQPRVRRIDGMYYVYYAVANDPQKALYVASSNDGAHFNSEPRVALAAGDWDTQIANSMVWQEPSGDLWMIYESMTSTGVWQMGLASGTDPFTWAKVAGPLNSLRHGAGTFGGPWLTKIDRTYHLWYHASATQTNLPTQIYHATSEDLLTWAQSSSASIVDRTQGWEVDQVADPSLVTDGGRTLLFYDGDDNVGETAAINVAVFNGSMQTLLDDPIAGLRSLLVGAPWYPRFRSY